MTVAATRPIFRILAMGLILYYAYISYSATSQLLGSSKFTPDPLSIRFTVLGLRDPRIPVIDVNPFTFGLLQDSCPVPMPTFVYWNVSTVVNFQQAVTANGYFLSVISGPPQNDPVRWTVEASATLGTDLVTESIGSNWWTIGASMWRGAGTSTTFYPNIAFDMPTMRNDPVNVDWSPAWPWIIAEIVTYFVYIAGWLLFVFAGFSLHQRAAVWSLFGTYLIVSVLEIAGAVGSEMMGLRRQAIEFWMNSIPDASLGLCILWFERYIVIGLKTYGFLKILAMVRIHRL